MHAVIQRKRELKSERIIQGQNLKVAVLHWASQVAKVVKNPPVHEGDTGDKGLIPSRGSGRSPGGGHGNPLQDSCLENPMDRGAWVGYGP